MAKIDQISDTDDWNETSGNGFLTSAVPFLEAKIEEQTSTAGDGQSIINLAGIMNYVSLGPDSWDQVWLVPCL